MNTKEKIVIKSLKLFSIKGYHATSIKDIAESLGIKDSSLYKHFVSKKAIFEAIFDYVSIYIDDKYQSLLLVGSNQESMSYEKIEKEALIFIARQLYVFYSEDDLVKSFRKMLSMERHHNPDAAVIYSDYFIKNVIQYQSQIFAELIEKGIFKKNQPIYLAYEFYSFLFMLIHISDQNDSNTLDSDSLIEQHIISFWQQNHV